jgi:hypothetical protein
MNTTHKPDPHQSPERKPMTPQHDDNKQHAGQTKPNHPDRAGHRDEERNAPHKK